MPLTSNLQLLKLKKHFEAIGFTTFYNDKNKCMKKKFLTSLIGLVMFGGTTAQCPAEKDDPTGGCPYVYNGIRVFDRCAFDLFHNPSEIGNAVCDAITSGINLSKKFEPSVAKFRSDAEKAMKENLEPLFKDAIDPQALQDYNEAAGFYNDILSDVKALINDRECGFNQIKNLQNFFNQQLNNIKTATGIIQVGYNVINKEVPSAVQNVQTFTAAANEAIKIANSKSGAAAEELKKIQSEFNTVSNNLDIVKQYGDVVNATTDLVTNVGALYGSCTACATFLTKTIAEVQVAVAAAGTTTATCPASFELAGGGCWIAVLAGGEGAAAALSSLFAGGACALMADQIKDIEADINTIKKFGYAIQSSGNKIYASLNTIDQSAQKLAQLASTATEELKPSVNKMSQSLTNLDANFENMFNSVNNDIIPKVAKFSGSITKQMVSNVTALHSCYEEYMDLAGRLTTESVTGIKDMYTAGTRIVDAAKVMDNAGEGVEKAIKSVRDKAAARYSELNTSWNAIERRFPVVWKNGSVDAPATAKKFADGLYKTSPEQHVKNMKDLYADANKLMAEINSLVADVIKEEERLYISKPDAGDKANAKAKSESARAAAKSAKEKLYKTTRKYQKEKAVDAAKAEAKRKSREKLDAAKAQNVEDLNMAITTRTKSVINSMPAKTTAQPVSIATPATATTTNATPVKAATTTPIKAATTTPAKTTIGTNPVKKIN